MWPSQNLAAISDILEHNRISSQQGLCIDKQALVHAIGTEFSVGAHKGQSCATGT